MSEPMLPENQPRTVRSVMTTEPVAVSPETSLRDVVELMRQRKIGAVVVVEQERPVGIFTERDLLNRASESVEDWNRIPICRLMTAEPVTVAPDASWQSTLDTLQQRGIRHAPVLEKGVLVGMLSLRDIIKHRTTLLESIVQQRTAELIRQKSVVEERDRERTQSLNIAGRIQRQLLPARAPEFDPLTVAIAFHPHDQVAGDYFDIQLADPDTLILIIGDASGHGVSAAFISVIAKTCVHTRLSTTASPAALLGAMNEFLYGWVEPEHFISMFVAAIDRRTLRMTYARAGHPLPILLHNEGAVTHLDAGGIMIGVLPNPEYPEQAVQLQPGDKVLFYTDGLTECPNAAGDLFGVDRVQQFLLANQTLECERMAVGLVERVRDFSVGGRFADDLTVVLLEVQRDAVA